MQTDENKDTHVILGRVKMLVRKASHTPMHLKMRSQLILNAAAGWTNNDIESSMKLSAKKVKRWRDRYSAKRDELQRIEKETPQTRLLVKFLSTATIDS